MINVYKCTPDEFDDLGNTCDGCGKHSDPLWMIVLMFDDTDTSKFLCTDCLQELRSKIGALSLLVTTGTNTV